MTLLQVFLVFPYLKYAIKLKQGKPLAFVYLWLWWSTCAHVNAANNSLRPGDTLHHTEKPTLYSKNAKYYLIFSRTTSDENNYLVICNANKDAEVWMSDTTQPVDLDSAVLSLNHSGVLKIESQRGKPIILYSPPHPINNTVATLLDTGNFVLQQLHPNGSTMSVLWQSFDYPCDTLVPTMKLGFNHKTGHHWFLVSWFTKSLATPGAFSLEWEPMAQELIIKRRGKVCWRSGKLRNNRFEHISEDAQRTLRYTVVSNSNEDSFSFTTTNEDGTLWWWLTDMGELANDKVYVARADMCFGYNNSDGGCQRWEDIPKCRNRGDVFRIKTGYVSYQNATSEQNTSYGYSDCEASCWSNCTCAGFRKFYRNGTGCYFFHWINSSENYALDSNGENFYLLENILTRDQHKGTKKWTWIGAVIATAVAIICLLIMCLAIKKRKYMLQGKKSKGMVMKMLRLATCNRSSGNFNNGSRSCCEKAF